jgi:hypothetical protein
MTWTSERCSVLGLSENLESSSTYVILVPVRAFPSVPELVSEDEEKEKKNRRRSWRRRRRTKRSRRRIVGGGGRIVAVV